MENDLTERCVCAGGRNECGMHHLGGGNSIVRWNRNGYHESRLQPLGGTEWGGVDNDQHHRSESFGVQPPGCRDGGDDSCRSWVILGWMCTTYGGG